MERKIFFKKQTHSAEVEAPLRFRRRCIKNVHMIVILKSRVKTSL